MLDINHETLVQNHGGLLSIFNEIVPQTPGCRQKHSGATSLMEVDFRRSVKQQQILEKRYQRSRCSS